MGRKRKRDDPKGNRKMDKPEQRSEAREVVSEAKQAKDKPNSSVDKQMSKSSALNATQAPSHPYCLRSSHTSDGRKRVEETADDSSAKKARPNTVIALTSELQKGESTSQDQSPQSSYSTTFKVFDVSRKAVKIWPEYVEYHLGKPITNPPPFRKFERLHIFRRLGCSGIVQGSDIFNQPKMKKAGRDIQPSRNGFVDTVIGAYMVHHNLILRPDDVWLAILVQFSFYVNGNSEKLRGKFVNFDGKKILETIMIGKDCRLDTALIDKLVNLMTNLVDKNLVDGIKDWIIPNFSTTTSEDRLTAGIAFLSTMKNFCQPLAHLCICGIPKVTLEGTLEDWSNIRRRIGKLREYDLDTWINMLEPILDQFVQAKSGDVDKQFWKNICHNDHVIGAGPYKRRLYYNGWITVFCLFKRNGEMHDMKQEPNPKVPLNNLPDVHPITWPKIWMHHVTVGYVDVEIRFNDNGKIKNTVMIAGHLGEEVSSDRLTVQPRSGWVLAVKEEKKNGSGKDCRWR